MLLLKDVDDTGFTGLSITSNEDVNKTVWKSKSSNFEEARVEAIKETRKMIGQLQEIKKILENSLYPSIDGV